MDVPHLVELYQVALPDILNGYVALSKKVDGIDALFGDEKGGLDSVSVRMLREILDRGGAAGSGADFGPTTAAGNQLLLKLVDGSLEGSVGDSEKVYVLATLYTHLVECATGKLSVAETGVVVLKALN